MLLRWFDLYETLTNFGHAFYQKWVRSDIALDDEEAQQEADKLWKPHVVITQVMQFIRDTLGVFINAS